MKRAIAWTYGFSGTAAVAQLGLLVIASRILTPAQYAPYALSLSIVQFASYFSRSGISQWVMRHPSMGLSQLREAAGFVTVGSMAAGIGIVVASAVMAPLWNAQNLVELSSVLAVGLVALSLAAPRMARMRVRGSHRRASMIEFGSQILGFGVSALLLQTNQSVVSLAIGYTVGAIIQLGVCSAADFPWRVSWDAVESRKMVKFVAHVTGQNLAHYALNTLPIWSAGIVLSPAAIGNLARASQISVVPLDQAAGVMGRVAYPRFGWLRSDKPELSKFATKGYRVVSVAAAPVFVAGALTSRDLVAILLGPDWNGAAPLLAALFLVALVRLTYTWLASLAEAAALFKVVWSAIAIQTFVVALAYVGCAALSQLTALALIWPLLISSLLACGYLVWTLGKSQLVDLRGVLVSVFVAVLAVVPLILVDAVIDAYSRGSLVHLAAVALTTFITLLTLGLLHVRKERVMQDAPR